MIKRIAALMFIFVCTSVAWAILGGTIFQRTYSSQASLRDNVISIWGAPHDQRPPRATYEKEETKTVEEVREGKKVLVTGKQRVQIDVPLEGSRVNVALDLEHRQKGLLWYSAYKVTFDAAYRFHNPSGEAQLVTFGLPFPASQALYDDLAFSLDGQPLSITHHNSVASAETRIAPGQTVSLQVRYASQGLDSWRYSFGSEVAQVRDFQLRATTNFRAIDFPGNTLAPTEKRLLPNGWELLWNYRNLVSGFSIGIAMPEKLQPGPLAGSISLFAPVSLFFFFFLMFIITTLRDIELHPMNYFFLACAFFAFHLLLAYLVDHIAIHAAFVISSVVSIFLVVSYLRLVVGIRFAAVEAGLAQLVYLVLFSYAFFFKGYTGLAVTIGSILTLFVVMQMTGRIRWAEKFAAPPQAPIKGHCSQGARS